MKTKAQKIQHIFTLMEKLNEPVDKILQVYMEFMKKHPQPSNWYHKDLDVIIDKFRENLLKQKN